MKISAMLHASLMPLLIAMATMIHDIALLSSAVFSLCSCQLIVKARKCQLVLSLTVTQPLSAVDVRNKGGSLIRRNFICGTRPCTVRLHPRMGKKMQNKQTKIIKNHQRQKTDAKQDLRAQESIWSNLRQQPDLISKQARKTLIP